MSLLPRVSTTLKAISTLSIRARSSLKLHFSFKHVFEVKHPATVHVVAGWQEHVISEFLYLSRINVATGLAMS